jgi:RNA polymerase sigma factor (sigma-70 family)
MAMVNRSDVWAQKERRVESNKDFADLVVAIAEQRDRMAFARLFDHFVPRLQAYLIRLGSDSGMAEEIAQDVMLTLWRKAYLFDPAKSSIATWLFRIARNRRIDGLRRDRLDFFDPMNGFEGQSVDPETDRMIDLTMREDRVRLALDSLPDEQLTLVKLAFFDGLSHSEIADRTKLPLGTVKSRIRLAFTRLRRVLEAGGVFEVG